MEKAIAAFQEQLNQAGVVEPREPGRDAHAVSKPFFTDR
jgi:hypothetical protein